MKLELEDNQIFQVAYLTLPSAEPRKSAEQVVVEGHEEIILDFDDDGRLIGIEFVDPMNDLTPETRAEAIPYGPPTIVE